MKKKKGVEDKNTTRNRKPVAEINLSLLAFIMQPMHLFFVAVTQESIVKGRCRDKVEVIIKLEVEVVVKIEISTI